MKSLLDSINEWKDFNQKQESCDDHARCSICKEQLWCCGCGDEMARKIMERLAEKDLTIIEESDRIILRVRIKTKGDKTHDKTGKDPS